MRHAGSVDILNASHFIEQVSKVYFTNYISGKMIARQKLIYVKCEAVKATPITSYQYQSINKLLLFVY